MVCSIPMRFVIVVYDLHALLDVKVKVHSVDMRLVGILLAFVA